MERHGHLDLDPRVRQRLRRPAPPPWTDCSSPSGHRRPAASDEGGSSRWAAIYRCGPSPTGISPPPGFLEIDLVAHCGGQHGADPSIYSLVGHRRICTGWTEAVPLLAREQSLVVAGLEAIGRQLPFPVKGIDSDNDGAFINETLIQYCTDHGIEFTRSRGRIASNDQAWIEQKNGSRWYGASSAMIVTPAPSRWTDHGAPLRGVASVRELLPALLQADRQDPGRRHHRQALQSAQPRPETG